uniref:Cell division control protein 73 C-terminal domain-containing protein n=1 Tax=Aegilops tauschii TaxID=37682 RepID=M8BPU7_AEGTA
MDPLAVLRDYAARGDLDKIIFNGDDVLFGDDYTFPANAPTAFTSKQSGRPYPLSAARPLKDRNAVLDARGRDFLAIYHAALRREEDRLRNKDAAPSATGRHEPSAAAAASLANPKLDKSLGDGFVPIILVPSASQTLITIYNVRDFLEDFVFVPSDEKMRAMKGSPKPECVTLQKKHVRGAGGPVAFEVRDKPASLKADDWARVVAVFVLGKEWQFKDWPFKGHVDIFNKVIGFFVRFEDDSVDSAKVVKQWNVKIISLLYCVTNLWCR